MNDQLVVFATPAMDHTVTLGFDMSTINTERLLAAKGIAAGYVRMGGDPYLSKVRNLLIAQALQSHPDFTDLFFIDADVEWNPQGVLKLLEHPADVVAGVYPKKDDQTQFPCVLDDVDGRLIESGGFYRALAVPTGFLRIKRAVIDRMAAASGSYRDLTGGLICQNIFDMGFRPHPTEPDGLGEWIGEDGAFCRKWRDMGGEIWAYPDISFGHRGGKTWRANFNDAVKAYEAEHPQQECAA